MILNFKTPLPHSVEKIRQGFTRDLFVFISPGFIPFQLKRFDGCKKGDKIHIALGISFIAQQWVSLVTFEGTDSRGWSFIDEGKKLPWPLSYWKHHHRVDKVSDKESIIVDEINFECSPAFLTPLVKPFLWYVFSIRPKRYRSFFEA